MSPKARQSKGQARLSAYEKLLNHEAEARREELISTSRLVRASGDIVFEFMELSSSNRRLPSIASR